MADGKIMRTCFQDSCTDELSGQIRKRRLCNECDPPEKSCQYSGKRRLSRVILGAKRLHKHEDPKNLDFWYLSCIGPWNQFFKSLCVAGSIGLHDLGRIKQATQASCEDDLVMCVAGSFPEPPLLLHPGC